MSWSDGLAEWDVGDTTYLSVAFSWKVGEAWERAVFKRATGQRVIAGGPAFLSEDVRDVMAGVAEVPTKQVFTRGKWRAVPGDHPDGMVAQKHNPMATFASRGCPVNCYFCNVPVIEGDKFTLIPDFTVRPILCDNNLSALPILYQLHIIEKYEKHGVRIMDANSGFEPRTFDRFTFCRWSRVLNGPWRFAYDESNEREYVYPMMRILRHDFHVKPRDMRVYCLIGNEPFDACMGRIQEIIDWGGEPHVQPYMSLNALEKIPNARFDWTVKKLQDVARWANGFVWRNAPFAEYDRHRKNTPAEKYDAQQGLFV